MKMHRRNKENREDDPNPFSIAATQISSAERKLSPLKKMATEVDVFNISLTA